MTATAITPSGTPIPAPRATLDLFVSGLLDTVGLGNDIDVDDVDVKDRGDDDGEDNERELCIEFDDVGIISGIVDDDDVVLVMPITVTVVGVPVRCKPEPVQSTER